MFHQSQNRPTFESPVHKEVPIGVFTRHGNEEVAFFHAAGIDNAPCDGKVRGNVSLDRQGFQDVLKRQHRCSLTPQ